ncbi:putative transcription factor bZIP family [Helianthus annuus]|nr:putative transcription factor bZIP family [Helianthus annuus]
MENPVANQLPEADSLPDGFVDSSAEPLTSSPATPNQESEVADYKEEKLIEVDSRPNLIADDFQSCEGDNGNADRTRTFPVELIEDASCDAPKLLKTPVEVCKDVSHSGSPDSVLENVVRKSEPKMAPTDGKKHAEKPTEQGVATQAARVQGTSETKRKSAKRTFKTEKEFFEFTLCYQKVLSERDAAISMRDKLESLCRELQHQNKMLMDECKRVSSESQNLRLELSNKFQKAIKDVTSKLEEQRDDSLTQLKENEMLRNQLKQKEAQTALTEQQHAHQVTQLYIQTGDVNLCGNYVFLSLRIYNVQLKQKTLELQIADLKIQQHEENLAKEQSQMKMYAEQVSQLLATEKNLRLQLTADGEKFQQFQDALVKSNEVFETFKQEIEKMTKSRKELKKENSFLKGKTEKSDFTLVKLVEEREHMKKQLEKTKNQKEKLESLCRSLQAERKQNSSSQNADSVPV